VKTPIDLRRLAETHRLRIDFDPSVTLDPSHEQREWCVRIPGKHGFISPHSVGRLAVYSDSTRIFGRLLAIEDVQTIQDGDTEIRLTFPPSRLGEVATTIKARRKRTVTDDQRSHLAAIGAAGRFARR